MTRSHRRWHLFTWLVLSPLIAVVAISAIIAYRTTLHQLSEQPHCVEAP